MQPDHHSKPSIAWLLGVPLALLGASCLTSGLDQYTAAGAGGAGGEAGSRGTAGGDTTGTAGNGGHVAQGPTGSGGSTCSAMCSGECVDLDVDPKHCGSCTNACPASYGCTKGTCDNVPGSIAAGAQLSCVVLRGGELWCWGRDVWGEVGIPSNQASAMCADEYDAACQPSPIKVSVPPIAEVGLGSEFSCARTVAGDVYCWGNNHFGRLGHDPATDSMCQEAWTSTPSSRPCSGVPQKVALPAGVVAKQLSVGAGNSCIVDADGDVYCWGDNSEGVIRAPVGGNSFTPVKNANVDKDALEVNVSDSAEGWTTACVVRKTSKHVDCWGYSGGTLFNTNGASNCMYTPCDSTSHSVPLVFAAGTGHLTADHVQIGYETGCVLDGGTVNCWGSNAFGQSGDGSSTNLTHFDPLGLGGVPAITQLSLNFATTLALDGTGQVWALGWNSIGQVGDGALDGATCRTSDKCLYMAHADVALTNIAQVSTGGFGAGAITKDGKVLVWGSNYVGELGHPPNTMGDIDCGGGLYCNPAPVLVGGLP